MIVTYRIRIIQKGDKFKIFFFLFRIRIPNSNKYNSYTSFSFNVNYSQDHSLTPKFDADP